MSKEEKLLLPRYKVIADYPNNTHYPLGKVITIVTDRFAENDNGKPVFYCEFHEYPHLFQPLDWWGEREYVDLPKYIKWIDPADKSHIGFFKVDNWGSNPNTSDMVRVYTKEATLFIYDCFPATEQEYLNHKKHPTS